jgi:hypothetical protein
MLGFKLREEFRGRPGSTVLDIFESLADALFGVRARGNIEKTLVCLRILHNGGGPSLNGEHDGPFAFLKLPHKITGTSPETRERLNVFGDVQHSPPFKAPFKVLSQYTQWVFEPNRATGSCARAASPDGRDGMRADVRRR